jgi:hypothetical protein
MKSSAEFFESFDKAGFLKPSSWTPSFGGGPYTPKVRFTCPDMEILNGEVLAADYAIRYVSDQLPGLKEGEQITVDGTLYRVRTPPRRILDGTVSRAELKK